MTRVNLIPPYKLLDQHLIAEYREIPMVISNLKRSKKTDIPKSYRLGTGHVLFFANKWKFLCDRHREIIDEMLVRGFSPKFDPINETQSRFKEVEFIPSKEDVKINVDRIYERFLKQPFWYKYYGVPVSVNIYRAILKGCIE
jgi:deoxyribonuclease (pyrimidine dimer)